MSTHSIVDNVKEGVAEVKSKVGMVASHGQDVLKTGASVLQAARDVVSEGGREVVAAAVRTKDELKRTLKEGAAQVGDKMSRLATPTRKEQAAARKLEVKTRKREKREQETGSAAEASAGAQP